MVPPSSPSKREGGKGLSRMHGNGHVRFLGGGAAAMSPRYPMAADAVVEEQMQWSKKGAHRLLQTRTRTLDGTLHDLFTTWYPAMPANDVQPAPFAAAA